MFPLSYSILNTALARVNGSSDIGNCSSVSHGGVRSTCTDPTSSVLFDGVIPTLTGLDGDMWASQLLTLQRPMPSINIDITTPISRIEVIMFNCPEWRISVQSISLRDNDGIVIGSSGDLNSITSCDSLVRLCVPATAINPLVVRVQFDLDTDSNWVHLAEVTFYNDNTTCPPNTITTEMNTAANTPITPTTTATTTQETDPDTTNKDVIISVVVVISVVFMIVGIMAAVLILWRYHKHKTSHHTALGEGHSHAYTHSHPPPVKMCEEIGQVSYSSPPEALGQLSPSHDTYSHLQRDTSEGRGGAQSEEADAAVDHFYAVLEDKNEVGAHLNKSEANTADMLYARVDKKKIKKKRSNAINPNTPETDTAVDNSYSVLEEYQKGEVATHPHTPEADTAMDQLCAQVDKNQKESVSLQELGPVHSALNKPSPPQLPDLLMEDLQTP